MTFNLKGQLKTLTLSSHIWDKPPFNFKAETNSWNAKGFCFELQKSRGSHTHTHTHIYIEEYFFNEPNPKNI